MEIRRRRFLQVMLAATAALAAVGLGLLRRASPVRVVRAWRARRYPGPLRALDESRVRQPGPWAG
ncbi:MAG: hypothetical protein KA248_05830 [Kiritimatiellae bacterium]|nr:hypothetical protein [Kiritimatiellia bacterium]